jgi:hypothetical protein
VILPVILAFWVACYTAGYLVGGEANGFTLGLFNIIGWQVGMLVLYVAFNSNNEDKEVS